MRPRSGGFLFPFLGGLVLAAPADRALPLAEVKDAPAEAVRADSVLADSVLAERAGDSLPGDSLGPAGIRPGQGGAPGTGSAIGADGKDTLELPELASRPSRQDSISREFKKYWAQVEKEDGFDKLRDQIRSRDIDKTWVPHFYLFDSSVVVFPFWIILREKRKMNRKR